jgi:hypothetical protein
VSQLEGQQRPNRLRQDNVERDDDGKLEIACQLVRVIVRKAMDIRSELLLGRRVCPIEERLRCGFLLNSMPWPWLLPYPTARSRYVDQTCIDNMFGAQDLWIMTDRQILVYPLLVNSVVELYASGWTLSRDCYLVE